MRNRSYLSLHSGPRVLCRVRKMVRKMAMTIVRGYGTEVCRKYHEYTTGAAMGVVRKFG